MQQQKACLCRNANPVLILHYEPTASLKSFLRQEYLDMTFQLPAVGLRKFRIKRQYSSIIRRHWIGRGFAFSFVLRSLVNII